ncbi:MAG: hypothetical protein A2201_10510, partial [Alicyclobacillus sp. RIFOXYA1_FULL_53_8]
ILTLWPIALFWRKGRPVSARQWGLLTLIGLAGAGTSYTYYMSLTRLSASLAIVLLFQFAWIVLLIDALVTRRMPALEKLLGIVLIVIGTVLAVGLGGAGGAHHGNPGKVTFGLLASAPLWAVLLGLSSAVFYSLTLYLSAYVDMESSPVLRSAITLTVSGIVMAVVFSPVHFYTVSLWHGLWYWGSLVAVFSQTLPMLLMYIAIPRIGGRMAGVLGSIELPVAVLVAHLVLSESVTPMRWLGVVLILVGIVVSEWRVIRPKPMQVASRQTS